MLTVTSCKINGCNSTTFCGVDKKHFARKPFLICQVVDCLSQIWRVCPIIERYKCKYFEPYVFQNSIMSSQNCTFEFCLRRNVLRCIMTHITLYNVCAALVEGVQYRLRHIRSTS